MKGGYIILVAVLFATGCFGQTGFPDSIPIRNMQSSVRLKGTQLFVTIPQNYRLFQTGTGYWDFRKDSSSGFQIVENNNDNFYRLKNELLRKQTGLKEGNAPTSKAIKVSRFDGIYYTGAFKMPKQLGTFLVFGDSTFAVTLVGVYPKGDKQSETELTDILASVNYDKSVIVDPLDLVDIKLDLNITGFKYVQELGMNYLTYSPEGIIKSIEDERHKSSFQLERHKTSTIENAEQIIRQRMEEFTEFSASKVSNFHHRNLDIGGHSAYEVTMDEVGPYIADTKYYIVVIQLQNEALLFWGIDRDHGKWLDKFKATVQSITWKLN